jgi:pre-rRNA-processing protein TSR2
MVNYVTDCCLTNAKVDEDNLIELLEDIMDQEFDTICDDNSIKEISNLLIRYLKMLRDGQLEQIKLELSPLSVCDMWIVPGRKINFVTKPDDGSSTDEGSDDEMEVGTEIASSIKNVTSPSTSGSTMHVEEEDIDPGWTKVKGKKRK